MLSPGSSEDGPDAVSHEASTAAQELVAQCLARVEAEGSAALETLCREHPEHEGLLRRRVALLASVGLIEYRLPEQAPLPGVIGPYRVRSRIGRGGMGVVYLAERDGSAPVALKLMRADELEVSSTLRRRFEREVESIARLSSEHVVRLQARGEYEGMPWFAMEYVEGVSLDRVVRGFEGRDPAALHGRDLFESICAGTPRAGVEAASAPPPFFDRPWNEVVCDVVSQVLEAVAHAHELGVIHRDLKPANVMLTREGHVKVLDFGLAILAGTTRFTQTGTPVGSLPYLSPEQVKGEGGEVGPASDVYAAGVLMYELLTLRLPYWAGSVPQTMESIVRGTPVHPRTLNATLSESAERVCFKAMDVDIGHRYASAQEFLADLVRLREGSSIRARPPHALRRVALWCRKHPGVRVAGAALALAIVALGAWAFERGRREAADVLAETRDVERRVEVEESVLRLLAMSHDTLSELPREGQEARLESIQAAADLWDPILREDPLAIGNRRTWGKLHRARGNTLFDLGRMQEALGAFRESETALRDCIREEPDDETALVDLAASLSGIARCGLRVADDVGTLDAIEESCTILEELTARDPARLDWATNRLAALGIHVKSLRILNRPFDAELASHVLAAGRGAADHWGETRDLEGAYLTAMLALANWEKALGRLHEAEALAEEVQITLEDHPESAESSAAREARALCADVRANIADAEKRFDECAAEHETAIEVQRDLARDYPENPIYRSNLALFIGGRGVCQLVQGNPAGEDDLSSAIGILDQLLQDHPADRMYSGYRAHVEANLAEARVGSDPESALGLGLAGLAALVPESGLGALRGHDRGVAMTLIHSAALAYIELGRLGECFELLERDGAEIARDDAWRARLVADCWNEWCLAFAATGDHEALGLDAGLAEDRLFEFLELAVETGYADRHELETTPALDAFRADERFQRILDTLGG